MTNMTKEQLEQLLNCTLTDYECGRIKECVTFFSGDYELFQTEEDIVKFYRAFGIDGIHCLYCHHVANEEITESYRADAHANFEKYVDAFAKYTVVCNRYGISVDEIPYDAPVEETHEDKSGTCQPVDMAVLKEHFESITNCTVTDNEYCRIEKCIDAFDCFFVSENNIVLFYHTFGINGIDLLLCDLAGFKAVEDYLREKVYEEHRKYFNLRYKYNQLNSHMVGFVQALSKYFKEILDNPVFNSDLTSYKLVISKLVDYFDNNVLRHESFESEVK